MKMLRLRFPDSFKHRSPNVRAGAVRDWCEAFLVPFLVTLADKRHFFGQDFGRKQDLSVIWVLQQQQDLSLASPLVIELRNCPFDQQRQLLFYLVDSLPRFMAGALDATGNGSYLAEVAAQRYGAGRIAEVDLSQNWYRDNMPRLVAHIEDGTIVLPKDADILADLRAIKKIKGVMKVPRDERSQGADGNKRHGDAAVALVLGIYAAEVMEHASIEYTPLPDKDEHWDEGFDDDFDGGFGGAW